MRKKKQQPQLVLRDTAGRNRSKSQTLPRTELEKPKSDDHTPKLREENPRKNNKSERTQEKQQERRRNTKNKVVPSLHPKWQAQRAAKGGGSGGVRSAGVSQSVGETGRDKSQSVPSPEKLFKIRDLELPIFEGSLPSCLPHSARYTRTSVHLYFPVAKGRPLTIFFGHFLVTFFSSSVTFW